MSHDKPSVIERYLEDYKELVPELADNIQKTIEETTTTFKTAVDEAMATFKKALDEAIEAVIKENPAFEDIPFEQLKSNTEFQKILKEYMTKKPLPSLEPEILEKIGSLNSIIPAKFSITNNKLSNEIIKDFVDRGEISLAVINVDKINEVRTYNSLTYEGKNISITGRHEFTAYDRAVHNAVCSLYVAGNEIISPGMVYRAMNGMSDNEKVSPQSIEAIKNSLDKSRFMRLRVDFTDEARARNMKIDKAEIDSNLLEARAVIVRTGGHETGAYKILATPVLYQYSQRTKQIISVPLDLLDTKEATRNTEEIISIKEYLIRRIEVMKHDSKQSNKIVYDTIFDEAGVIVKRQTERNRYRQYIKDILSLWKSRDKYIENFNEYKDGKMFKGLEIFL